MSRALNYPVAVLLVVRVSLAQSPPARPRFDQFEVASIKPAADSRGRFIRMQSAHQFIARNHSVRTLVAAAYNLNLRAISGGPDWTESDHFDITAKSPNEAKPNLDEQMAMLRALLTDRFKLAFHWEKKEMPVYLLTVAKGGPRLKPTAVAPESIPEGPPPLIFVVSPDLVRLPGRYATVGELASVLQRAALDHPVLDQTGLTGRFDFDLQFAPDETQFGGALGKGPEESTVPGLFAALQQQLGLKMETTRGPVDVMVIDRVERPSEN